MHSILKFAIPGVFIALFLGPMPSGYGGEHDGGGEGKKDFARVAQKQEELAAFNRKYADKLERKAEEKGCEKADACRKLAKICRDLAEQNDRMAKAAHTADTKTWGDACRIQQELREKGAPLFREVRGDIREGKDGSDGKREFKNKEEWKAEWRARKEGEHGKKEGSGDSSTRTDDDLQKWLDDATSGSSSSSGKK